LLAWPDGGNCPEDANGRVWLGKLKFVCWLQMANYVIGVPLLQLNTTRTNSQPQSTYEYSYTTSPIWWQQDRLHDEVASALGTYNIPTMSNGLSIVIDEYSKQLLANDLATKSQSESITTNN
jgi:hypothetical protein